MSDIVYLKMHGEQQGDISSGCGSMGSIGNRYQLGHEDEIFAFSLSNEMSGTGSGVNFQTLSFSKLIDKSSPLLADGITRNEKYFLEFNLYRINKTGRWERYFYIELRGTTLTQVETFYSHNNLDTEVISVRYEYIKCIHLIANTEFSYLAFPENYNDLFTSKNLIVAAQNKTTINSRAAGQLLAAGGIYNGNIEGFRQTAEQLGGDAPAGYKQVMNPQTLGIGIAAASIAAGATLGRLNVSGDLDEVEKLKTPHVLGDVKGEYSAINPGPLADNFAETFSGGVYKEIVLSEDTTFFRAGASGKEFGQYLGYEQPLSVLQARIDKALLPVWPNGNVSPVDTRFDLRIPAGNTVYVGETGYQHGFYQGGTDQVFIFKPWDIPGVKVLNRGTLK